MHFYIGSFTEYIASMMKFSVCHLLLEYFFLSSYSSYSRLKWFAHWPDKDTKAKRKKKELWILHFQNAFLLRFYLPFFVVLIKNLHSYRCIYVDFSLKNHIFSSLCRLICTCTVYSSKRYITNMTATTRCIFCRLIFQKVFLSSTSFSVRILMKFIAYDRYVLHALNGSMLRM